MHESGRLRAVLASADPRVALEAALCTCERECTGSAELGSPWGRRSPRRLLGREVLIPLLGLSIPEPRYVAAGAAALASAWAVVRLSEHSSLLTLPAEDWLAAAAEATFFAGFLLGATRHLGPVAWAVVAGAAALTAFVRGTPPLRALAASAAMVGAMLWSGSTYVAFCGSVSLMSEMRAYAHTTRLLVVLAALAPAIPAAARELEDVGAAAPEFEPDDVLHCDEVETLRPFLPTEFWDNRDFFFSGFFSNQG